MKAFLLLTVLVMSGLLRAQDTVKHVYFFNGNFNESSRGPALREIVDSTCTDAALGAFGKDSIITSSGLCTNGDSARTFKFNPGGGVQYANSTGLIGQSYTIHIFFKFNTLGGYSRIIDFSNSTSDKGIYLLQDCLNFYPNGNQGTCPYFEPGKFYLISFVRDSATKVIRAYVDGKAFSTYTDSDSLYTSPGAATPLNFFRDDNAVKCEVKSGSIKYLSISNKAVDSTAVSNVWANICGIALPVTWVKVAAAQQGKNVLINWSTATESNSSYFSVEHSTNAREFSEVGRVVAKENSSTQTNYSFTHYPISDNIHYYRIKEVDKDNHYLYSPILKVTVNDNNTFAVFPNPAKGMITVSGLSATGVIRIFSLEGKNILTQKVTAQTLTFNLGQLHSGVYMVQYTDGKHSYIQKMVKQVK